MDQGRQERASLDAAVLPCVPPQRGAAPASRHCLQSRQFPVYAGPFPRMSSTGRSRRYARSWSRLAPGRASWTARRLPAGRGSGALATVRRDRAPGLIRSDLNRRPGMSWLRQRVGPGSGGAPMISGDWSKLDSNPGRKPERSVRRPLRAASDASVLTCCTGWAQKLDRHQPAPGECRESWSLTLRATNAWCYILNLNTVPTLRSLRPLRPAHRPKNRSNQ
jgi:hypothetical protein